MEESIEDVIIRMLGLGAPRAVVTAKHVMALAAVLQARQDNKVKIAVEDAACDT